MAFWTLEQLIVDGGLVPDHLLIPHLRQLSPALWADAAIAGMITSNDQASITCCDAFINLLWKCLHLEGVPERNWWIDTFVGVASQIEEDTTHA